jgi:hypothetical protein
VQYATVYGKGYGNGQTRSVSYTAVQDPTGNVRTIVKITNLQGSTPSNADGTTVCFKLRDSASTKCPTAVSLCDGPRCLFSIFNNQQDCCPTDFMYNYAMK